jgi:hypothetical protein
LHSAIPLKCAVVFPINKLINKNVGLATVLWHKRIGAFYPLMSH